MQAVTLIGNLTRDPTYSPAGNGKKAYGRLSLAVNERRGEEEVTNYYDVTLFSSLAENVAFSLRKGNRVLVTGRLSTSSETIVKADGSEGHRTRVGIVASAVGPELTWATAKIAKAEASAPIPQAAPQAPAPKAAPAPAPAPKPAPPAPEPVPTVLPVDEPDFEEDVF